MKQTICCLLMTFLCVSCDSEQADPVNQANMDDIAHDYLLLELSMGLHDAAHVDAYFGPDSIRKAAEAERLSLDEIATRASTMKQQLTELPRMESTAARIEGLVARLSALMTRIALNQGETLPFDEEAVRLFGASAPDFDDDHFDTILQRIDELLPGDGTLADRVVDFRKQFAIPSGKLSVVFDAAIAECRKRTLAHIELPPNESFRVEYVNDKPWSGYNWYQGDANSLIQVNTDLPIFVHRAVDLGCHEGYPGHHTFNVLLEKNLVREAGWIEFTLYPLFSPESLIAEGSGNYGINLAFPGRERLEFEQTVLFPLAGLDASQAETYYTLLDLLAELTYAENEAARDYLNGVKNREQTIAWLIDYTLSSEQRAAQRSRFFDTYRSYIINYNLGKDMVSRYVERGNDSAGERWKQFEYLLSSPMLPEDLQE